MKPGRIENLVSWMWTGGGLAAIGLFFVVFGWFLPTQGAKPFTYRGGAADPEAALVMGLLVIATGVVIVGFVVVARLRDRH
jgi:hypothetical protein